MSKPKVLESESMTMSELKSELKKIKKRDEELSYRAGKTAEYLDNFQTLKLKEVEDLRSKMEKLKISRMKKEYMDKLIDIMPRDDEEVTMILSAYPFTITKENITKLTKTIKEFIPDKK